MNEKDFEDYQRGLAGQNPLSLAGQLGVQQKQEQEAWHKSMQQPFSQPSAKRSSEAAGGGGGGNLPLTDFLADGLRETLNGPLGRPFLLVTKTLFFVAAFALFMFDGNVTVARVIFALITGYLAPKILYYVVFLTLAAVEALIQFVFGLLLLAAIGAAVCAGLIFLLKM